MAYPNIVDTINVNTALFRNYESAGSTWCTTRKNAKGKVRARDLMLEWGLAEEKSNISYRANCSILNRKRRYSSKAHIIDPQRVRRKLVEIKGSKLAACEQIEYMYNLALEQHRNASDLINSSNGKTKDNLEIAKFKWANVKDWIYDMKYFQGGTYDDDSEMDTCEEESLEGVYKRAGDRLKGQIDLEDEPIPNSIIFALCGVGAIVIGVLLNKVIK